MTCWSNDVDRFWGSVDCDELFLLFDTSAHVNDGTPDVDSDQVLAHVEQCSACGDADVRVSVLSDGTEALEGGGVA